MIRTNRIRWPGGALVVCLLSFLAWQGAAAQNTTGMIRGHVKDQNGVPLAAAEVQARNLGTGVLRTATTKEDGAYALPGLVPGTYELTARHIGNSPRTLRMEVQIGATQLADFSLPSGAIEVQGVTVTAAAPALETRTSELATVVTQQQIQQLPTPSRNFLDLAALAPGVTVAPDRVDLGSNTVSPRNFSSGAQGPGQVNVFIDGASLKNDLTGGEGQYSGIAGQDNSRGNPFPRNAIQEYRVITQNFKAEYQQASSAIITATTRSGTNTWTGDAFFNYQNQGLVALDTFQRATPNFTKPDYSRYLGGADIGGPLIRNKLFFFGSYEGNYQNRAATVDITPPTGYAALDTVPFNTYNGNFQSPFRETLLFGKLNYAASPHSSFELSGNARIEHGVRDFGGTQSFQSAVNYNNTVTLGTLKHSYVTGPWLNEAKSHLHTVSSPPDRRQFRGSPTAVRLCGAGELRERAGLHPAGDRAPRQRHVYRTPLGWRSRYQEWGHAEPSDV
jgi:hypothetical protein